MWSLCKWQTDKESPSIIVCIGFCLALSAWFPSPPLCVSLCFSLALFPLSSTITLSQWDSNSPVPLSLFFTAPLLTLASICGTKLAPITVRHHKACGWISPSHTHTYTHTHTLAEWNFLKLAFCVSVRRIKGCTDHYHFPPGVFGGCSWSQSPRRRSPAECFRWRPAVERSHQPSRCRAGERREDTNKLSFSRGHSSDLNQWWSEPHYLGFPEACTWAEPWRH